MNKLNRRKFLKGLLGCSAAVALPVVGKAVSSEPVIIGVDLAKPDADESFVVHRHFVSRDELAEMYPPSGDGGYMMTNEMAEKMRTAMQPHVQFRKRRNFIQEEMNKIASARVDIIKTANVGPTVIDKRANMAREMVKIMKDRSIVGA